VGVNSTGGWPDCAVRTSAQTPVDHRPRRATHDPREQPRAVPERQPPRIDHGTRQAIHDPRTPHKRAASASPTCILHESRAPRPARGSGEASSVSSDRTAPTTRLAEIMHRSGRSVIGGAVRADASTATAAAPRTGAVTPLPRAGSGAGFVRAPAACGSGARRNGNGNGTRAARGERGWFGAFSELVGSGLTLGTADSGGGRATPGAARRSHEPAFGAGLERRSGELAGAAPAERRNGNGNGTRAARGDHGWFGASSGLVGFGLTLGTADSGGGRATPGAARRSHEPAFGAGLERRSGELAGAAPAERRNGNGERPQGGSWGPWVIRRVLRAGGVWADARNGDGGGGRSTPGAARRSHEPAFGAGLERRSGELAGAAPAERRNGNGERPQGGSWGPWVIRRVLWSGEVWTDARNGERRRRRYGGAKARRLRENDSRTTHPSNVESPRTASQPPWRSISRS
jgi:hypothetical protein